MSEILNTLKRWTIKREVTKTVNYRNEIEMESCAHFEEDDAGEWVKCKDVLEVFKAEVEKRVQEVLIRFDEEQFHQKRRRDIARELLPLFIPQADSPEEVSESAVRQADALLEALKPKIEEAERKKREEAVAKAWEEAKDLISGIGCVSSSDHTRKAQAWLERNSPGS